MALLMTQVPAALGEQLIEVSEPLEVQLFDWKGALVAIGIVALVASVVFSGSEKSR